MNTATSNPLLQPWNTAYGLPPFEAVEATQFEPAFEVALAAHRTEVDAIGAQLELPSFENTVAAFDRSGRLLRRLEGLFYNLTSSETSPALQAVERRLAPRLAAHRSAVSMHAPLFARLEALHREREMLRLSPEQQLSWSAITLTSCGPVRGSARSSKNATRSSWGGWPS